MVIFLCCERTELYSWLIAIAHYYNYAHVQNISLTPNTKAMRDSYPLQLALFVGRVPKAMTWAWSQNVTGQFFSKF